MPRESFPLPPELIRLIVANFASSAGHHVDSNYHRIASKQDLRSCSLVNHEWRAISEPFLFSNVLCVFTNGIKSSGRLAQFREFLKGAPVICAYVRKLTLDADSEGLSKHELDSPNPPEHVDVQLCWSILSLLPHIQTVRFCDIYLAERPSTLSLARYRVSAVQVHYECRQDFEDVVRLVDMFDEIGTFQIDSFHMEYLHPDHTYKPQTKVSALVVGAAAMQRTGIMCGLVTQAVSHEKNLISLQMDIPFKDHTIWVDLHTLMGSGLGSQLTHLGLSMSGDIDTQSMVLRSCPQLKSFALLFPLATGHPHGLTSILYSEHNGKLWRDIIQLVPSLPLTVQSVVFTIDLCINPACSNLCGAEEETAQVEVALVGRLGKSLSVVAFRSMYGLQVSTEERGYLKRSFPMLARDGIMQFD